METPSFLTGIMIDALISYPSSLHRSAMSRVYTSRTSEHTMLYNLMLIKRREEHWRYIHNY